MWIVIAQLFGTSLWFSANAATDDLRRIWGLDDADVGHLTIAVQAGFIMGTLGFAVTALADRFAASRIFAASAVVGAVTNAGFALFAQGVTDGLAYRFATGLALAGVYPLGMKLVVGWAPDRAGHALGWLVGMLALGTALPQFVRGVGVGWSWQAVVLTSSVLALVAAYLIWMLGDGPNPAASPTRTSAPTGHPSSLSRAGLPRIGVGLFRAYVGGIRVLDDHAVARGSGDGGVGGRQRASDLAGGVCCDRHLRTRIVRGRSVEHARGQRPGGCDCAWVRRVRCA